jgi:transposase-like protein
MPRHYPAELRRQPCERMLAGEAVKDLSAELGISGVTLYKWRRQALIDAGQRPGLKSYEADPLLAARRRVKELEAELKAVKAASALFEEGGADPKASSRWSEGRTTWATQSASPVRSSASIALPITTSSSANPTTPT